MTTTEVFLELLKYILPAGLVLTGVLLVMRENTRKIETREKYGILKKTFSEVVPLRLQAYERAILFLERIAPENLLIRVDARGKESRVFHQQLIQEIRAEFEHNLAQQLYIKDDSWRSLVVAKEQVISLINTAGRSLPPNAPGVDLGRAILNKMVEAEKQPTQKAIKDLKEDVQGMFRF